MKLIYKCLILCFVALLRLQLAWAQGTTTAAMNGAVQDESGAALPGATVIAVHTPTNTQYVAPTNTEGRYNFQNMRVGGPYTVTIRYVGYQDKMTNNINLGLGQNLTLNFTLASSSQTLNEVQVVSKDDDLISIDRTGAATQVSTEQIESLPTISRSLSDFTRITPQASTSGSGTSFAGQNNRFNNFSIDGTVNNDVFGLSSSGTNGGQTGVQPISLDAIEAIQVVIAPFDVRQSGFTGGGINAITRSGSNKFKGSAYWFGNSEKLVGKSPDESRTKLPEYTDYQAGFRVGGPIVKNKLFFFLNAEKTDRTAPLLFAPGTSSSNITVDEANRILSVANRLGYDPGSFASQQDQTSSEKIFARLDWNINNNNQLTLRHSYVHGQDLDNSRSPNSLRFSNNAQIFPSNTNSTVLQLRSSFGEGKFANEAIIGYTAVRDDRDIVGAPFPAVTLRLSGGRTIALGSEPFSVQNQLNQDVFTVTNNFNAFIGKHTFTLGTSNEFYKTFNLFIRQEFGAYEYNSIEAFEAIGTAAETAPSAFFRNYSRTANRQEGAQFSAYQLGFYAQDEYAVMENLKVTGGIRFDIPTFNDEPAVNQEFNEAFAPRGLATNKTPGAQFMISPRIGVNWDVFNNNNTQIRGGAGIFTGRAPFVWIANQYTNTGLLLGSISATRPTDFPAGFMFSADPNNQPTATNFGRSDRTAEINITDPNFKFPQLVRFNAAVDQRLPGNFIATLEGIYSQNLNNIYYQNLNVQQTGSLTGADNRPIFSRTPNNFQDIIYLTNTNKGYSYSATAQVQKGFEYGLTGSVAYTYSRAKDVNPGGSSQARSNWINVNQVYGLNNVQEAYSDNDVRSRVVAAVNYVLKLGDFSSTTISAFYNGQSGIPLSYIYNGDVNGDAGRTNDLIYIPRAQSEINLVDVTDRTTGNVITSAADQWTALDAFIEGNDYLSSRRGQYAERNGDRLPWQNQVDVRLMQEFALRHSENSHKLQLTLDILNVGNLINKNWGKQYQASFNANQLLDVAGGAGTATPTFNYTGRGLTDGQPYFVNDFFSRWRGQVGVRYIFD